MKKRKVFSLCGFRWGGGRKRKSDEKAYIKIFNYLIIIGFHFCFHDTLQCQIKGIFSGKWH